MESQKIHERFHYVAKVQRSVISERDFTYRNIIEAIKPILQKEMRVIDVGCGVSTLDFFLASKVASIDAFDIARNAIRTANKSKGYLGFGNNLNFYLGDFLKSRLDGKYDLAIASEVLEHLPDPFLVLLKIHKILRAGGIIFVSVPSKYAPLYRLGLVESFDKSVGHLRRYSRNDIVLVLKRAGYKIMDISMEEGVLRNLLFTNRFLGIAIKFLKGKLSDLLSFADSLTISLFGSSQILVVARKK